MPLSFWTVILAAGVIFPPEPSGHAVSPGDNARYYFYAYNKNLEWLVDIISCEQDRQEVPVEKRSTVERITQDNRERQPPAGSGRRNTVDKRRG